MAGQIMQYTYGNAWNNAAVLAAGNSASVAVHADAEYGNAWGVVSANTTITFQTSDDGGTNWDDRESIGVPAGANFAMYLLFDGDETHMRLSALLAATITGTLSNTIYVEP